MSDFKKLDTVDSEESQEKSNALVQEYKFAGILNPTFQNSAKNAMELLPDDKLGQDFLNFMALSCKIASSGSLREIPKLVISAKILINQIIEEAKQYAEVAGKLYELISGFIQIIENLQYEARLVLVTVEATSSEYSLLCEILGESTTPDKSFSDEDIKDMQVSCQRIVAKTKELGGKLNQASTDCESVGKDTTSMVVDVITKSAVVKKRLDVVKYVSAAAIPVTGAGAGITAGALSASSTLGAAGCVAVGGLSLPAIPAVLGAIAIGGVVAVAIYGLVHFFLDETTEKKRCNF